VSSAARRELRTRDADAAADPGGPAAARPAPSTRAAAAVEPGGRAAVKLRALNEPRAARVHADENGVPILVVHGRQRLRVEAVRETWRIDDEWWRRPISRIYHEVVLEDGKMVTLYQDLAHGGWFMQG
jgi:hypothetical protein